MILVDENSERLQKGEKLVNIPQSLHLPRKAQEQWMHDFVFGLRASHLLGRHYNT
jgi:hypothetical protein